MSGFPTDRGVKLGWRGPLRKRPEQSRGARLMSAMAQTRAVCAQMRAIVRVIWIEGDRDGVGVAQERDDEHERICRTKRNRPGPKSPDRGWRRVLNHCGARLFAFLERHDAIAGAGALPDAEGRLWPQLCADRVDYPSLAGDFVAAATGCRAVRRSPPAAPLTFLPSVPH